MSDTARLTVEHNGCTREYELEVGDSLSVEFVEATMSRVGFHQRADARPCLRIRHDRKHEMR